MAITVLFPMQDADVLSTGPGVEVVTPLEPACRRTRCIRATNPEERVHTVEEAR